MDDKHKPKLVLFRWAHPNRAAYIRLHLDQQVKCLSQFFEVTVINGNCDYQSVCDSYHPDLALFESGVYVDGIKRQITNISANPQIPKVGFCQADAMCGSRSAFIADMAKWGIDTFFTLSVSMPEYMPDIARQLYVWPNSVDSAMYHNYGETKNIPVLITGSLAPHYPWRNRVSRQVSQYYPSMTCPHFGWGTASATSRMIHGEQYARLLNASWFVPTCGTVANDIVRKHFEIPASKACLITQKTAAVEAAGFLDWHNCIYADERDVIAKLDYLFHHRDELERITTAGHDLVHSRHTIKQRDQILQWFILQKELGPRQRIVQHGPYEALTIADDRAGPKSSHVLGKGLDRVLLQEGDRELWRGKYETAERFYVKALNYLPYLPEAKLRLAICSLHKGEASVAMRWIKELIRNSLEIFCAEEPDPIEWTYLLIAVLCTGELERAAGLAEQYPALRHPELDRIRHLIRFVQQQDHVCETSSGVVRRRHSVHQLPTRRYDEWIGHVCTVLRACNQNHLAEHCARSSALEAQMRGNSNELHGLCGADLTAQGHVVSSGAEVRRASLIVSVAKLLARPVRARLLKILNQLEYSCGYFLPYRLSAMRSDELFGWIEAIAREPGTATILVRGAAGGRGSTEACLTGAQHNPSRPTVILATRSGAQEMKLQRRDPGSFCISCSEESVDAIRRKHRIDTFGMVVVAGGDCAYTGTCDQIRGARVVVLDGMSEYHSINIYQALIQDNAYRLLGHNPNHYDGGYAIFRKK